MPSYIVTYMRTSYMEIEVEAENCRDAATRFEALTAAEPLVCEHGDLLAAPRYHVVDVVAADRNESSKSDQLAA